MRLAIVVGHDSKSKGAYATAPLKQYEYDYNIGVAEFAYRKAMSLGMGCRIFLRNKIGIRGVYAEVNKWADDNTVCVELHFNSFDGKAKGTETLFDKDPNDSIELAREIHLNVCSVFKRKGKDDRGLKLIGPGDRGYLNLNLCKKPSCIVEPFFGDNANDADLGLKLKLQYADAIVEGVFTFFENREKMNKLN